MPIFKAGVIATAAGLLVACAVPSQAQQPTKLTYFTGPTGGSWIPIGGALKSIWEKAIPGLTIENRPGAGLVNLKAIQEDKAEIGMGNLISSVDAGQGKGQGITAPYDKVCHLGNLYPQVQQMAVRADIGVSKIADLKGKAFGTLPRGNTTEVVASWILEASGITYKDLAKVSFVSIADQANQFKDGQIMAMSVISTVPTGGFMDIANSRPIKMMDVPEDVFQKLLAKNAGFSRYTIPKGTYPGMDKDNLTVQFPAHVIISCKLPDDLVYKMAKAMTDALPELVNVNAAFKGVTVKEFGAKVAMKVHPGALKYWKERGAQ